MSVVGYFLSRLFLKPVREKIEALDRFIEDTTHELNTPISAILMTTEQLKGIDDKKITRLKASAKRLSRMYSSLLYGLDTSHKNKESIDLAKIVKEQCESMEIVASIKRIALKLNIQNSCKVLIAKEDLQRLIDNVISNAIKYSPIGSQVEIILNGCTLEIKDKGIGISKEEQKEIFKRYYRSANEQGGFGIGLNIVMQICKENSIEFNVESQKGVGSIFSFKFKPI